MGMGLFKNCGTGYAPPWVPTNAPDPKRFTILDGRQFEHAHVLVVKYPDATNFEGIKVMVFRGQNEPRSELDPHFYPGSVSPIARFRPDEEGVRLACILAKNYKPAK